VADLLKLLLKIRAREIDAAACLLARSDDLELLAAGVRKGLARWKAGAMMCLASDALDLVEGKLALAVKGRLKMTHVDELHGNMRDANPDAAATDGPPAEAEPETPESTETPEIPKRTTRARHERLPAHAQAVAISGGTARGGHFGRAAEACFVSQSTLSAGLRDLETLLGVVLVERTKRNVRFTPLGEAVVAKAHRILREAEELSDLIHASSQPLSGEVDERDPHHRPPAAARCCPGCGAKKAGPGCSCAKNLRHRRWNRCTTGAPIACCWRCLRHRRGGEGNHRTDALFVAFPKDDLRDPPAEVSPDLIDEHRLLLLEDGHCLKEHAPPPATAPNCAHPPR
jgi:hypothetical protein